MANANAPTAEIADPSFAALVAAMQQLTLVLNGMHIVDTMLPS